MNVRVLEIGDGLPGGQNIVKVAVENTTAKNVTLKPVVTIARPNGDGQQSYAASEQILKAKEKKTLEIPYDVKNTGDWRMTMALGGDSAFKIGSDLFVSDFYNTNYGELLSVPDARGSVWWASSGWKFAGLNGHVLKDPPEGGFGLTGDFGGSIDDFNRA